MQLIPHWRQFHRFWSIRLSALGAILIAITTEFPHAATALWMALPADLKSLLPPDFGRYLGYAIVACGLFARVVHQPRVAERAAAASGDDGVGAEGEPDLSGPNYLDR
ncbi:DUF7940 domain-containing protein [Verticiella alkaliphila]|uniref:DUF7940 domain-containing protein n=1 Tax=Verticiella alkaliphila TaxID=2779529 RepID=UPI003FCC6971